MYQKPNQKFTITITAVVDRVVRMKVRHEYPGRPIREFNLSSIDGGKSWYNSDTDRPHTEFLPTRMVEARINEFKQVQNYARKEDISPRTYTSKADNKLLLIEVPGQSFYTTKYINKKTMRLTTSEEVFAQNSGADVGVLDGKVVFYDRNFINSHERGHEIIPMNSYEDAKVYISRSNRV